MSWSGPTKRIKCAPVVSMELTRNDTTWLRRRYVIFIFYRATYAARCYLSAILLDETSERVRKKVNSEKCGQPRDRFPEKKRADLPAG